MYYIVEEGLPLVVICDGVEEFVQGGSEFLVNEEFVVKFGLGIILEELGKDCRQLFELGRVYELFLVVLEALLEVFENEANLGVLQLVELSLFFESPFGPLFALFFGGTEVLERAEHVFESVRVEGHKKGVHSQNQPFHQAVNHILSIKAEPSCKS